MARDNRVIVTAAIAALLLARHALTRCGTSSETVRRQRKTPTKAKNAAEDAIGTAMEVGENTKDTFNE